MGARSKTRRLSTGGPFVAFLAALFLAAPAPAPAAASLGQVARDWKAAPPVPVIAGRVKRHVDAIVRSGIARGNNPRTFIKVGDSNMEMGPALYGFSCARPSPTLPRALRQTVARYNRVRLPNPEAFPGCGPWTSFSRRSAAARSGTFSNWSMIPMADLPLTGFNRRPAGCRLDETPLSCEIRVVRPRFAFILTGTNDLGFDAAAGIPPGSEIGLRLRPIARTMIKAGIVPVFSSIPPVAGKPRPDGLNREAAVARTNRGIWTLARKMRLPFVNLWRAMAAPAMINQGLADDGVHLSVFGAEGRPVVLELDPGTFSDSVVFRWEALRYGSNRRNLIVLETLRRLDRATG